RITVTRKFSIVPSRSGALRIPGPRIAWWDVRAAAARTASLPDLQLQVEPGVPGAASGTLPGAAGGEVAAGDGDEALPGVRGGARVWAWATVGFALLWLVTLAWALQRGPRVAPSRRDGQAASPETGASLRDLRRVLDSGDFGEVAQVLCAMAAPPAPDLD